MYLKYIFNCYIVEKNKPLVNRDEEETDMNTGSLEKNNVEKTSKAGIFLYIK